MIWSWRRIRGDFAGFPTQVPLVGEAGADPVGEESDVRMVDEPSGFELKTGRIWR
jgi:hypothetical protein